MARWSLTLCIKIIGRTLHLFIGFSVAQTPSESYGYFHLLVEEDPTHINIEIFICIGTITDTLQVNWKTSPHFVLTGNGTYVVKGCAVGSQGPLRLVTLELFYRLINVGNHWFVSTFHAVYDNYKWSRMYSSTNANTLQQSCHVSVALIWWSGNRSVLLSIWSQILVPDIHVIMSMCRRIQ